MSQDTEQSLEPLCRTTTFYTYAAMKTYLRFQFRGVFRLAVTLLVVAGFGGGIGLIAKGADLPFPFLALGIIAIALLCSSRGGFYTRAKHEKAIRLVTNGQRMEFFDAHIVIRNQSEVYAGESRIPYATLIEVREFPDFFYLYIHKNQAYLVDKKGFELGTPYELRVLLQARLGPRRYHPR